MTFAAQQLASHASRARSLGLASRRRRVPRARPPTLIESDYAGRLVAMLARARATYERLLPAIVADLPRRLDEGTTTRARSALEQARAEAEGATNATQLEGLTRDFGRRVSGHHRGELQRQTRAALGVEPLLLDPRIPGTIEGFVHENASLIRSLGNRTLDDLENIIVRAYASGTRAEAVAEEIAKRFDVAERHARLIARDQIGKLHSRVTEARHAEIGLASFEWHSLKRPTARPAHVARHGKRFRYDNPPADGLPGEAILCSCLQHPVFDDIIAMIPR